MPLSQYVSYKVCRSPRVALCLLPCHQLRLFNHCLFLTLQLRQRPSTEVVALAHLPLIVLLAKTALTSRITAASLGKIPTTSVLLFTSLFSLSSGLFDQTFCHCSWGEGRVGEDVFFIHQGGQPRKARAETVCNSPPLLVGTFGIALDKDGADGCAYHLLGRLGH